ncbi:hypothetical protein HHX47_DHR2000713 [Lentinula edodes]|nr:hypothetical protein HHX47_DHR2000713 [Lentinula edodes]
MSNMNCPISAPSDPPSIFNDLVKRIQEAIPLDQTIPFWKNMWKRHLMSTEGERLRSQKKSELPSTIAQITSPQYLVHYTTESKFSFRAQIYQQTALFYQLGTILNKWTPLEVKETWKKNAPMKIKYFPSIESSPPKGLFSKLIGYLKPQSAMSKIEKDGLTESTLAYTPHGLIMAKIIKNSVEYFKFEHEVSSYMKKFHIPHPEDAIGAGTMYDYKDLRLHKVCKDQQKIASCGQHRWIITTGDPTHPRKKEDKVEMVLFDAFSDSCLKRMIFNFNHSTEVAALQRQGRDMIPFGTRVPKGGAPADGLRPFEGINATTTSGVDEFFAQAEVGDLLIYVIERYINIALECNGL